MRECSNKDFPETIQLLSNTYDRDRILAMFRVVVNISPPPEGSHGSTRIRQPSFNNSSSPKLHLAEF